MIQEDITMMKGNISAILHPDTVAVVGASGDRRKLSGRLVAFLRREMFSGEIFLVNKRGEIIDGVNSYRSVNSLPKAIDLAIVCIGAEGVLPEIRSWEKGKISNVIVISSGFKEIGQTGSIREQELVGICEQLGIGLIGPNCLGLVSAFDGLAATFSQYADQPIRSGPIAFVSQSGAFGTAIASLARARGLGLGYFVNTGNEAMFGVGEVLRECIRDPRISVGAAYFEGVRDGEKLIESMIFAAQSNKPLLFMKVGKSERGALAAASHTGALAGDNAVFDGICRQFGVIQVKDEVTLLDVANVFVTCDVPDSTGVGIVTLSGGAGVLMTDLAESMDLELAELTEKTTDSLERLLPEFGSSVNPVDVTAQAISDPALFEQAVDLLMKDLNVGIVVVWIQLLENAVDTISGIFRNLRGKLRKPLLVSWIAGPELGIQALRDMGYPVYSSGTAAMISAKALSDFSEITRRRGLDSHEKRHIEHNKYRFDHLPENEVAGFRYLRKIGISVPDDIFFDVGETSFDSVEELRKPLVAKVIAEGLHHKTDVGGVALGLRDSEALQQSVEQMSLSVRRLSPQSNIKGFLVQEMYQPAGRIEEMVVGLKKDPSFGMLVMVGFGGIMVEFERDVGFRKTPVNKVEAEDMVNSLRGRYRLGALRGFGALNVSALCDLIVKVSLIGEANQDELQGLDLNPVLVDKEGVMVVDCLFV